MARIKHTMTAKEYNAAGKGRVAPKPGIYRGKLVEFTDAKPAEKDPRWELIYEITQGEHAGFRLFDYVSHKETSKFRKDQLFVALGLVKMVGGKAKVMDFDPDNLAKYPEVNLRVRNEDWQGEMQARVNGVLPADEDADEEDADTDEEEDDEDDSSPLGEDEDEDEDDEDDEEEVDFDSMSVSELREWAEENEIEIPAKLKGAGPLRAFLAEATAEEESEDEDEEEDDETEEIDLSVMKIKELRALADENEVDHTGLNSAQLREALQEALGGDEDDDEEEEEEADYSTWKLSELKAELEERGLKTAGAVAVLRKRLEKSDADGGV